MDRQQLHGAAFAAGGGRSVAGTEQAEVHEKVVPARRIRRDGPETLLAYAEGLARIAAGGGGPQALASHLAAAIDATVLVEDTQWRHLAVAGTGERAIPASVRDLISHQGDVEDGVALSSPATPGQGADAGADFGTGS